MLRFLSILFFVFAAAAQNKKPVVPPNEAVITIEGLCSQHRETSGGARPGLCATSLTRRQFEGFLNTMRVTTRGVIPRLYLNFAEGYADLLVYSDAGRKDAVEKDPRFEQVLTITRLRALGDMFRIAMDDAARRSSPQEIEKYYKEHREQFEEVGLRRIALPRNNQADLNDPAYRAKAAKLAVEIRERAVRGEDMDRLQREALESLDVRTASPGAFISVRRRDLDAKNEQQIFALKRGEVSPIVETPALYLIYKGESRATLALEQVSEEIAVTLYREKLERSRKAVTEDLHTDYSELYFGPTAQTQKDGNARNAANSTVVAPAMPVLTIHGLCAGGVQRAGSRQGACVTVVTKGEFESILGVLRATNRRPVEIAPRDVAAGYVDLLAYAAAAKRAGLDRDLRLGEVLSIARMRALADLYRLRREERSRQSSSEEIEAYYRRVPDAFEEVQLRGISIPKGRPSISADEAFRSKAARLAAEFRMRALNGEDTDKLEQEAYRSLELGKAPATTMSPLRMAALEERARKEVASLQPGEVTSVLEIPTAYVIYKLEGRRTVPLTEARDEISQVLYRQKLESAIRTLNESIRATYNKEYFTSPEEAQWVSVGELKNSPRNNSQ